MTIQFDMSFEMPILLLVMVVYLILVGIMIWIGLRKG